MTWLCLAHAETIASAALAEAREKSMAPLAIVVLDAGGHMILAKREDGASLFRVRIAEGKALGSLGMGFGSRELADRAARAPSFFAGLMALTGEIVPSPGGVLIRNAQGVLLGAVGVSGASGDNDETAAVAGIAAAGLIAQAGSADYPNS